MAQLEHVPEIGFEPQMSADFTQINRFYLR